jgi:hypothetical protein
MCASADGGTVIVLIAKRPNEPEVRLFCGAKYSITNLDRIKSDFED